MDREIRQKVRILDGGKVEFTSADLPVGAEADLIIIVRDNGAVNPIGLFFDEAEVFDQVVDDAMKNRTRPMRADIG